MGAGAVAASRIRLGKLAASVSGSRERECAGEERQIESGPDGEASKTAEGS